MISVTEGVELYSEGTDPYIGDMFHETPLALVTFYWMIHHIPRGLHLVFILSDLLTAFLLYKTAKKCASDLVSRLFKAKPLAQSNTMGVQVM